MCRASLLACVCLTVALLFVPAAYAQKGIGASSGVAQQDEKPAVVLLSGKVLEVKTGPCENSADLPGMKPEEFDVQLKEDELWITGERKQETEQQGRTYHRMERYDGKFRRVIPPDAGVDAEDVEAEYKDGVLRITVAKKESAQRKRIEVRN